jgi:hypothetical protein
MEVIIIIFFFSNELLLAVINGPTEISYTTCLTLNDRCISLEMKEFWSSNGALPSIALGHVAWTRTRDSLLPPFILLSLFAVNTL